MRYTVTLTEPDDVSGNPDAKVVSVTPHTGEAFEVLAPAVSVRNDPREIDAEIRRETDGATVNFGELVEDARVSATTPQARELWGNAMADLFHGWVHPWDDGAPMFYPHSVARCSFADRYIATCEFNCLSRREAGRTNRLTTFWASDQAGLRHHLALSSAQPTSNSFSTGGTHKTKIIQLPVLPVSRLDP
ncbi:MAG: hypothetical protein WCF33_24005 [Pseudonocardiaceae bacterium]